MSRIAPSSGERVEIAPRRKLTPKTRLEILIAQRGRCEICSQKIIDAFDVDHRIPLALGGADDATNWRAVHPECHREQKTKADVAQIAKAKRQSKLRLDEPRTVSPSWGKSRGFGQPIRVPVKQKRISR